METENIKKLAVIFPKKENKKLDLEIDFGAPVDDLVETLENFLSVGDAGTIKLFRSPEENPQDLIKKAQNLADQGVLPGATLFGFVVEKGIEVEFAFLSEKKRLKITDKMTTLKDIKNQIFVALGLNPTRQYNFIRLSNNTEMEDDHTFEHSDSVQIREIPNAGWKHLL